MGEENWRDRKGRKPQNKNMEKMRKIRVGGVAEGGYGKPKE
jgi:hypothetical protein